MDKVDGWKAGNLSGGSLLSTSPKKKKKKKKKGRKDLF